MLQPDHDALAIRIRQQMDHLPPLSPTVAKVIRVANDVDASAGELIQVIKLDPVLTAKVLRLINSPFFGLQNVTSVARALVVLGHNTVKNLALSSSLARIMQHGSDKDDEGDELWQHSLGVGVAARLLARKMNLPRDRQEAAFVGGLMHDLGKILTYGSLFREVTECRRLERQGMPELEAEKTIFGTTHVDIGGMLGRKWQFPNVLLASIEKHHTPLTKGEGVVESHLTCLANAMYYRMGLGADTSRAVPPLPPSVWKVTALTESAALKALESIPEEVEDAKKFLGA